ncbi:MAG: selenocysteine-specific translation elongation factor, partial [Rhizobiaceae bacterium]
MIIGTAGHIDHGKTQLVKALTGVTTDRLEAEKARGISIELGFAYIPVADTVSSDNPDGDVLGFVDVPGHEKFVHTMVAGATGIDFALLVVAADDGLMPQTREHLQILDLLGISEGIVAITKIDLVDDARIQTVENQIRNLLIGTFLEDADILQVSAVKNTGLADLKQLLLDEAASRPERHSNGNFRLAIDRSFTLHGTGTVVTGAVRSGSISVGDTVIVLPHGQDVRVRSMHAQGRESDVGRTGERCALNLVGIDKNAINRGDWLVDQAAAAETDRFDAEVLLLETEEREVKTWTPIHLHVGTSQVPARIVILEGDTLEPGDRALVQIVSARPLPLIFGDKIVIRDTSAGRTIGGGHVVDPSASKHRRRSETRRAVRTALRVPDAAEALDALLIIEPRIVNLNQFVEDRGLTEREVTEILDLLEPEIFSVNDNRYAAQPEVVQAIGDALVATLANFHEEYPELPGMPLSS